MAAQNGILMATAVQKEKDPTELGKKLVNQALGKLKGQKPGFAFLAVSCNLELDKNKVVAAVRQALGNVPLLGATSFGEFTESEVSAGAASLALFPASENYRFSVACASGLQSNPHACVEKMLSTIPPQPKEYPHRSAFWLHDGLSSRSEELMLEASQAFGPDIIFAGGAAAPPMVPPTDPRFKTYVIANDKILADAVAVCVIDSKKPMAVGVKNGHFPISGDYTITKAKEGVVLEIDGKPAWRIWEQALTEEAKKLGLKMEQMINQPNIVNFPIGIDTGKGYRLRVPMARVENGGVLFTCTMVEGVKFRFMKFDPESAIASAGEAAKMAKKNLGDQPIAGAFVFDCAVRAMLLGESFPKGIEAIRQVLPGVPLVGFETYGETCRQANQLCSHHHATTVVMLLPA